MQFCALLRHGNVAGSAATIGLALSWSQKNPGPQKHFPGPGRKPAMFKHKRQTAATNCILCPQNNVHVFIF